MASPETREVLKSKSNGSSDVAGVNIFDSSWNVDQLLGLAASDRQYSRSRLLQSDQIELRIDTKFI